jgi:fructan beta-fructosidase
MFLKPACHFTPQKNWMNDPNGLVYCNGEYHLFYQHFPDGLNWGAMHWGHAVSKDLIKWEHLPIALYPDRLGTIFSGSAVVDMNNSSGFGSAEDNPLVAIYTHFKWGLQRQGIAYSNDSGRTWTPYNYNPVLKNPFRIHFRDPKVFYHRESSSWVMVLTGGDCILFYTSKDLKKWDHVSSFGKHEGSHGSVWECPDLFPVPVDDNKNNIKWVLLVSVKQKAPNGGSGTQYFTGNFDGIKFTNDNPPDRVFWLDYGKDNYAGVTWSDIPENDGRRIFIGWMSNWQYAAKTPADTFRGQMTLPRELSLTQKTGEIHLAQKIVRELDSYTGKLFFDKENIPVKSSPFIIPEIIKSMACVLELHIKNNRSLLDIIFKNNKEERIEIKCDMLNKTFSIDRSHSGSTGFSRHFPGVHTAPFIEDVPGTVGFKIYFDSTSVELITCDGLLSVTELIFPSEPFSQFILTAPGKDVLIEKIILRGISNEPAPVK